ncbi:MAG TPA: MFS transporter [Candidatus Acidoferrum sp.]|nr:MFS transporter [Candidatus Acidoferrum sp.]
MKTHLHTLFFASMGHFINDGVDFIIPLIGAIFSSLKEVTPFEVTIMFLMYYGSGAVFSSCVGRLADKTRSPGSLIGVGTMLMSVSLLGYFVTLSYTTGIAFLFSMMFFSFLAGFGSGFFHPLVASVLRFSFDRNRRGRVLGINGAVGGIGRTLYPSLFFFLAIFFTTYGSLAFLGFAGAAASIVILVGLRSQSTQIMSTQSLHSTGKIRDALTTGIVGLTLVTLVSSIAAGGIASWIPIYISKEKGFGLSGGLGLALTAMAAGSIVGQPLFGWLQERFDARLILGISFAGTGLSILGYLIINGIFALVVMFALFGFFTYAVFPLLFSLSSVYVGEESSSLGNAIVWGLGLSGGNVIGPLIIGTFLIAGYGKLGLAFEFMAATVLISAVGTVFLPKPKVP